MGRFAFVALWAFVALCFSPLVGQAAGWTGPSLLNTNATTDSWRDRYPQIIEDSSGTLHAVWYSDENLGGVGTDYDIFYATDSGSGWSAPSLLNTNATTDSGGDSFPQIIEAASGILHAVWYSNDTLGGTASTDNDIFYASWSAPTVSSAVRADPDPTNASSVDYTVTFSEIVTGVDTSDFGLNVGGVSGASVSGVSGSGSSYTVTVNTGSGDGTIRLDVTDDDTIVNGALLPLGGAGAGNGNYTAASSTA